MNKFKIISLVIVSSLFSLVSVYYYHFFSPIKEDAYSCVFKKLSGYDCSGCGGQRAFHYLLHGDFVNSFKMNPLLLIIFPVIFYYLYVIIYYVLTKKSIESFINSKDFIVVFLVVILLFGVLRNH